MNDYSPQASMSTDSFGVKEDYFDRSDNDIASIVSRENYYDRSDNVSGAITDRGHLHGMLGDSGYCLDVPLRYDISKSETGWSGYVLHLDLPAYGDTKEEVVDDLKRAIVEYYEILHREKDADLGSVPKLHKVILSNVVKRRT